jgi:hypothetical protein
LKNNYRHPQRNQHEKDFSGSIPFHRLASLFCRNRDVDQAFVLRFSCMANFYGAVVAAIKAKESPALEATDNAASNIPVADLTGSDRLESLPVLGFFVSAWVIFR